MDKNEIKKYETKKGLRCCSVVDFETGCSDCPYRYRCSALYRDALDLITEQEKEIEQLTRECNQQAETLAEEQEACVECELEQSWELFARDKEIDRLGAEIKRLETFNDKLCQGIYYGNGEHLCNRLQQVKSQAVKEFAKKLKARITKFTGRHDLSVRFFNDIMSDLLKEYEK